MVKKEHSSALEISPLVPPKKPLKPKEPGRRAGGDLRDHQDRTTMLDKNGRKVEEPDDEGRLH